MKIVRPMVINDAALLSSSVAETDYQLWASGTTYNIGAHCMIAAGNVHRRYQSLQNTNIGHAPAANPDWWYDLGPTNRWAMFDNLNGSQTSGANSIEVVLKASGLVNAVALLNVAAATIRVKMEDAVAGVVYDQTVDMACAAGINGWYDWFYEARTRKSDLVLTDLPAYPGATITITLGDPGATVCCGTCILGRLRNLGFTQFGASPGLQSFSTKDVDADGNYVVKKGKNAKRGNFTVEIDNAMLDHTFTVMKEYLDTPVLYLGTELFDCTKIFGFYREFVPEIRFLNTSVFTLELEGLT